jgi:uncharacterized protein YqgV (UPF0045/DUF77 family)
MMNVVPLTSTQNDIAGRIESFEYKVYATGLTTTTTAMITTSVLLPEWQTLRTFASGASSSFNQEGVNKIN